MTALPTLVFETSTPHASLALVGVDGTITRREFTGDRSHNAELFKPLKELLGDRQSPGIGRVLVGSGPGSYSGTRVGIAAAQGVAIACGCPAVALPSILAVPAADAGGPYVAIGDARRGSYWTAWVEAGALADEPALTDPRGLVEIVSGALSAGMPVVTFEDPSRFPLPEGLRGRVQQEFPDAARLWAAWQSAPSLVRVAWQGVPPQPIYLKPPHITPAKRSWPIQPQS